MKNKKHAKHDDTNGWITRRNFLKLSGAAAVGMWVGKALPDLIWIDEAVAAIPASEGYLLVDTKKCQGCMSCMLACSLVHEGVENLALARIQVIQNPFERWPLDLTIEQCRQCVDPACVAACPAHALESNPRYGNVRIVNKERCTGCGECTAACPYTPSRALVVADERYQHKEKARKCDLCAQAPYHWHKKGGGPQGKQACVEVCPVKAIKFAKEIPIQEGEAGYKVNLRDEKWASLGYPMD
ncbi:MAG TPA: 4Fe-4S dicluster domain-containing protein [Thermodesulfobacteriota bacterium]|jgi:protein NrfC